MNKLHNINHCLKVRDQTKYNKNDKTIKISPTAKGRKFKLSNFNF